MAENADKRVAIYITPELHLAAKTKAARLGTSFQQILAPKLEAWTHGTETISAEPGAGKSATLAKHARWQAMLASILESGDRDQIQIIEQQLQICNRQVAASVPAKAKRAG